MMQNKSSNSVVVWSTDREVVEKSVRRLAEQLRKEHGEVERIIWFGSRVRGQPGPRSDVDLCIVVASAGEPAWQRAARYLPTRFPTGLDLVVVTAEELNRLRNESPEWHRAIISGIEL